MWISLTENADWSKPGYPGPHSWTNDFYGRWMVHDSLFTSLKPAPGAPKKFGETRRNWDGTPRKPVLFLSFLWVYLQQPTPMMYNDQRRTNGFGWNAGLAPQTAIWMGKMTFETCSTIGFSHWNPNRSIFCTTTMELIFPILSRFAG